MCVQVNACSPQGHRQVCISWFSLCAVCRERRVSSEENCDRFIPSLSRESEIATLKYRPSNSRCWALHIIQSLILSFINLSLLFMQSFNHLQSRLAIAAGIQIFSLLPFQWSPKHSGFGHVYPKSLHSPVAVYLWAIISTFPHFTHSASFPSFQSCYRFSVCSYIFPGLLSW